MAFPKKSKEPLVVKISRPKKAFIEFTIEGGSRLVVHQFASKSLKEIQAKQAKGSEKAPKNREKRNPEQELQDSYYKLHQKKGGGPRYGFPVCGIKKAMATAGSRFLNMEKTQVNGLMFLHGEPNIPQEGFSPIECVEIIGETIGRTDMVRLSGIQRSVDVRYRGSFEHWSAKILIQYNPDFITPETLAGLLEWAGQSVGIGENRTEKGGDWGRFSVASGEPKEGRLVA